MALHAYTTRLMERGLIIQNLEEFRELCKNICSERERERKIEKYKFCLNISDLRILWTRDSGIRTSIVIESLTVTPTTKACSTRMN